jgi:sugar/nucleoside kinase (ribokinase family)
MTARIVVLGDLNLDVLVRASDVLQPGEEARGSARAVPGGSAATFARVASAEGTHVTFLGAVGKDLVGDLLEQSLETAGVRTMLQRAELPTGVVVALHLEGDRSMICSRGANDGLTEAGIDRTVFAEADHLHVSGYALLSDAQRPAVERALALAKARGCSISLDPPPASLIETFGVDRFDRLIEAVDWLFPNLTEGRLLTRLSAPDDVVGALSARFSSGALTMGHEGAIAWRGHVTDRSVSVVVDGVETTGAGDAYAGAFAAVVLRGCGLSDANRRGCEAARDHLLRRATY